MDLQRNHQSRPRRFKPIGAIVRNGAGIPIGRLLRLELEGQTVAFDRTGELGRFNTVRQARRAIHAKARSRR